MIMLESSFVVNLISSMQTNALKSGALRHGIHYWLGKDTSQVTLLCYLLLMMFIASINSSHLIIYVSSCVG